MVNQSETITIDIPENFYLSKEEISQVTEVSIHTLQNWINDNKSTNDKDTKILKGGKKIYSINYLKEILKKVDREELLVKLMVNQNPDLINQWSGIGQPLIDQVKEKEPNKSFEYEKKSAQPQVNQEPNLINVAVVEGKNEVIESLKEQLKFLTEQIQRKDEQIQNKDEQLAGLGQVLMQEQGLHYEARKDLKLAQEQNKLLLEKKEEIQDQPIEPESSTQPQVDVAIPPKRNRFLGIF